ncbi:MAG: GreA/GreB family elongation factor [bacterium]
MEENTLVATLEIEPETASKLQQLKPGNYCVHRSWGMGKVKDWDQTEKKVLVDFPSKPSHGLDFDFAAKSLQPLDAEHISVRLAEDVSAVRAMAENDPVGLVQVLLRSFQQETTIEKIEKALVPALFSSEQWKKWWGSAKRALKKDARYEIPTRRNQPIVLHDEPRDPHALAVEEFRKTVGAQAQAAALLKLEKIWKSGENESTARELVQAANKTLTLVPKSQIGQALELVLARDDFMAAAGVEGLEQEFFLARYLPSEPSAFNAALAAMSASKQGQCLERARAIFGARWSSLFLSLLPSANSRLMDIISRAFQEENRLEELLAALERLIHERRLNSDVLVWICKNRDGVAKPLASSSLFMAMMAVLEQEQFNGRAKLHDLIVNDKTVLRDLLASISDDEARDITRSVLLTSAFEELNKRSVLAALVKLYPFVQSMIAGEENKAEVHTLIVSWSSLEKRKAELDEIISKKIPENKKEIAVARSYGDLRENHEFKAAKEMQTVLMRRKAELESMLSRAKGTDFSGVDISQVNIGAHVRLVDEETKQPDRYTILGAWDSEPEKGIISYLTPVAQTLLQRKTGETVELPLDGGKMRRLKIEAIEAYRAE